jgi:hypothetical protein
MGGIAFVRYNSNLSLSWNGKEWPWEEFGQEYLGRNWGVCQVPERRDGEGFLFWEVGEQ